MEPLPVDIHHVSFSRYGAYLVITGLSEPHCRMHPQLQVRPGLWLRNFHDEGRRDVFCLEPVDGRGERLDYTVEMTPAELRLQAPGGCVRFCLSDVETLRVRTEGIGLRLSMLAGLSSGEIPLGEGAWRLNAGGTMREYALQRIAGELSVGRQEIEGKGCVAIQVAPGAGGEAGECALVQTKGQAALPASWPAWDQVRQEVEDEFETFRRKTALVAARLQPAADLAAYINWSSVVCPCGHMTRPGMLMSKKWMGNIWSWDHCFTALGQAEVNPELAWDQFMVIFDHQTGSGQLPDMINDTVVQCNFLKPPVHGWAYRYMMRLNDWFADPARMEEAYECLARWTEWWFEYRDPEGSRLPHYHHGNDSGWDNGTVFDVGVPVQGPDLAAFIVLQMDVLAELADRLGRAEDAALWRARCGPVVDAMLEKLWIGDRFVTRHAITGEHNEASRAIINCMPLLIADRLPEEVRAAVVERLRENLTDWGLATEHPDSPLYEPDGYWRGPIWASPTLLLIDGLRTAGETGLAATVAERFRAMCVKSGFSENYNAVTGEALRDRSYTWASSVFLVLARELAEG
jgi:hypothetical protein